MGEEKVGEKHMIGSASAPSVEYHPPKFMAEIGCNHMVTTRPARRIPRAAVTRVCACVSRARAPG